MADDDLIPAGEIVVYQTEDGRTRVECRFAEESIWMSQALIAELFQTTPQNITLHLQAIYAEGEIDEARTCKDFLQVRSEGSRRVRRSVKHYNLDAILAVGYRVRSERGTQFRRWATERLREYLVKGFTMDDERLKNPPVDGSGVPDYFDELLARIRDIRASERRMYLRVREIFALAGDYDPRSHTTLEFFQPIQNRLHFAATGKTAPELISERADRTKPNMGLTTWKGDAVLKSDVTTAKNYLAQDEISELNRIVTMWLDFAEDQARRRKQVFLADWESKLDEFLRFNERAVLHSKGTVSADADARAEAEYEAYAARRRELLEAEGERASLAALESGLEEIARRKGTMSRINIGALLLVAVVAIIGCGHRKDAPSGSLKAKDIAAEFAIYYLPAEQQSANADNATLFRLPSDGLTVDSRFENDVAKNYPPPDRRFLDLFGRGLTDEQKRQVASSHVALMLHFKYSQKNVWRALRQATELTERIARESNGLIWDDTTREMFTPDAWKEHRLTRWKETIPDLSDQTVAHVYDHDDSVRAITLGMSKFGLPDVVMTHFGWAMQRNVGHTINMTTQSLAEGAIVGDNGRFTLDIHKIRNAAVRDPQLSTLGKNGTGLATLTLIKATRDEGDPDNRLIEITAPTYPGKSDEERNDAMLSKLFGAEDSTKYIKHSEKLLEVSRAARAQLPNLRERFNKGLAPGEYILVKSPFTTDDGGTEWMWVEVRNWNGDAIQGLLDNDPDKVSHLHAGQPVDVHESEVFDYIIHHADGTQEGNTTAPIIEKEERQ